MAIKGDLTYSSHHDPATFTSDTTVTVSANSCTLRLLDHEQLVYAYLVDNFLPDKEPPIHPVDRPVEVRELQIF